MKIIDQKEKRSIILIRGFFTLLSMGIIAFGVIAYQDFKEHHHDQVNDQLAAITNLKMNELIDWRDGHLANAEILRQNSDFAEHVREYPLQIILTCLALIFVVSAALAIVWREHRMRYFRQQDSMAETLSKSEERYHNFIMHSFEAISRMEFDHPIDISLPVETQIDLIYENAYIAECNQALADMFNVSSPAGLLNIRLIEVHGSKDNPVNRTMFRKFIENGYKSINEETFEVTAAGKPLWFLSNTIGMIENDHLVRMWSITINITERKLIEQQLQEAERKYRTLVEYSPVVVYIDEVGGEWQYLSPQVEKVLGYSPEDLTKNKLTFKTLIHPDDLQQFQTQLDESLEGGGRIKLEYRLRSFEGNYVWVRDEADVIKDPISGKYYLQGVFHDITEQKKAEEALTANERRYRALIENIGDGIELVDARGIVTYASPSAARLLGHSQATLLMPITSLIHLDDLDNAATGFTKVFTTHETVMQSYRALHNDGSWRWLEGSATNRLDDPAIGSIVVTFRDVTERKRAEDALRESESFLQSIVRSAPGYIVSHDLEGYFLYTNHRWPDQGDVEFYNMKLQDLLHPDNADAVMEAFQKAITTHEPQRVEQSVLTPGGGYHWFDVIYSPRIVDGEVKSLTAFAYDINDLKIAQSELLELNSTLEERFQRRTAEVQDLYDNAPNGYHSLDPNGAVVLINQTELNWLGYTREEILEKKMFRELLTPASQLIFDGIFPRFKTTGTISDLTIELIRKDGSILPVLLNASAIYDEYGNFTMSRSITTDITEHVRIENALRESRDELNSANIALEKAARLKDEFLASMSHELRTPLTGVLGLSEALQLKAYGELNDRQLKTIKSIEDSGRHLLVLINDILDLSKIEAGKLDLQLMSSSLNDICQSSLQLIKGMAQHKKQNIHYSAPDEPIVLNADPRRIKQVLANLLSNAVKFTPENGELGLEIETVPSEKKVKLIVWDKGIGIKPENMHKLFKPFTQIDSSLAREYSGTGLGLSLAHRLVELHHGDIELESVFGEGSRFTVILPWSTQEPSLQINEQESLAQIQFEKPGDSPTVMVADDNETVLELLTDFLESKQYRVIRAHSGDELLSKVAEICPDLILMDIQMPGMDGLDTIRCIRSNADLVIASTPIIAVTALAMPGDRERCLLAGADDYMSKPMKLNELAALIRKMKRKK
ncbi:MAG: PAS domain S-box protein [Anaerolineales bacterium]|nr:PAS domain S-box protein [Anaerolineales bacterium]